MYRMKQLNEVEKKWTEWDRKVTKKEYRKNNKNKKGFKELDEDGFIKGYKKLENLYSKVKNVSDMENLRNKFFDHHKIYQLWEEFPYHYYLKFWRIAQHTKDYGHFYKKYDDQGITQEKAFFHFCKNAVYEYSPSFKEELLRQESLIRLFAGIYRSTRIGKWLMGLVTLEHVVFVLLNKFGYSIPRGLTPNKSIMILILNFILLVGLICLNYEIVNKIRYMRVKELQICFDSFYILCKERKLQY